MIKGGVTYRLLTDHLGSVRLVVDATTGQIAQRLDYDAFGRVLSDTNPGFQPFGFAGGLYDAATSLVRFGARDYDAEVGRWTAKDPIGFASSSTNIYEYVQNAPVNLIDDNGFNWSWRTFHRYVVEWGVAGCIGGEILGPAAFLGCVAGSLGGAAAYAAGQISDKIFDIYGEVRDFFADDCELITPELLRQLGYESIEALHEQYPPPGTITGLRGGRIENIKIAYPLPPKKHRHSKGH
jgi:RHS repeat-associated protein